MPGGNGGGIVRARHKNFVIELDTAAPEFGSSRTHSFSVQSIRLVSLRRHCIDGFRPDDHTDELEILLSDAPQPLTVYSTRSQVQALFNFITDTMRQYAEHLSFAAGAQELDYASELGQGSKECGEICSEGPGNV